MRRTDGFGHGRGQSDPSERNPLPPVRRISDVRFSMAEIHEYDIPDMPHPTHPDVVRNKLVYTANLPPVVAPPRRGRGPRFQGQYLPPRDSRGRGRRRRGRGRGRGRRRRRDAEEEEDSEALPASLEEDDSRAISVSQHLSILKNIFLPDRAPSRQLMDEASHLFLRPTPSTTRRGTDRSRARANVGGAFGGPTVAPHDQAEISRLRSGEDAVAFFSRAGKNTAVKFVYLNRADIDLTPEAVAIPPSITSLTRPKKLPYRPYSLVVVPREQKNPEYFTMSASGVVHIQPGQPTEYMSLSDWMKESTMFTVLRRIRFFKYYLAFKCFKLWYKNARRQNFEKKRKNLARELFLAKKTFASTLVDIRQHAHELQDIEIMGFANSVDSGGFETERFMAQQQDVRSQANTKFANVAIADMLENKCKMVKLRDERPKQAGLESPGAIRAYLCGKSYQRDATKAVSVVKRSKSMHDAQQEHVQERASRRKARYERSLLGDYIRLCDYMSIESRISLVKNTLVQLFREMELEGRDRSTRATIMFHVAIKFDPHGALQYSPTRDAILELFRRNSSEMVDVVAKVPRLLNMHEFKDYFVLSQLSRIRWRIEEAFGADEEFQVYTRRIQELVRSSFDLAKDFGGKFRSLREIFEYVQIWNEQQYRQTLHTATEFADDLQRVEAWGTKVRMMQINRDCGILKVDSRPLQEELEPQLDVILWTIKTTIHLTCRLLCIALTEELEVKTKELKAQPSQLEDFASFVRRLNLIKDDVPRIERDMKEVGDVFDLFRRYRTKPGDVQFVIEGEFRNLGLDMDLVQGYEGFALDDIHEDLEKLMRVFQAEKVSADLHKTKNMEANTERLRELEMKIGENLSKILTYLETEKFTRATSNSSDILGDLAKIGEDIREERENARRCDTFTELFNEHPRSWELLKHAEELYGLRKTVWQTYDDFQKKIEGWKRRDVGRLGAKEINDHVRSVLNTIISTVQPAVRKHQKNRTQSDDVLDNLLVKVRHWREREKILLAIGNPDLKEYHWKKIFQSIGETYQLATTYDLKKLEGLGIFDHRDIVFQVSRQATGEEKLRRQLMEIEARWTELAFNVKDYRDMDGVFVLGSVEEIFDVLEGHLALLQTMQANEYIHGVKRKVDEWERKLNEVSLIIEEWLAVQKKWSYLEFIFDSDDIKKQLVEENAKFQVVNDVFTKIMQHTNQNRSVLALVEQGVGDDSIEHLDALKECNILLEEVQQNLDDFLRAKRDAFPRFSRISSTLFSHRAISSFKDFDFTLLSRRASINSVSSRMLVSLSSEINCKIRSSTASSSAFCKEIFFTEESRACSRSGRS